MTASGSEHTLEEGLDETRRRLSSAALRYGRDPADITLLAVSKAQPAEAIRTLAGRGQLDFGENYLQEALPKLAALSDLPIRWHFIGQLQANKTRTVAEHFDWAHAVDRERIAVRLNDQRPSERPPLNICIQVRLEDEPGKGGVAPAELPALAQRVSELPRLRLRGLMCIPPPRETFEEQRALFEQLAHCQRELLDAGLALDSLSMGMSADLEAAIAAGATLVRIGTAIFGARRSHG